MPTLTFIVLHYSNINTPFSFMNINTPFSSMQIIAHPLLELISFNSCPLVVQPTIQFELKNTSFVINKIVHDWRILYSYGRIKNNSSIIGLQSYLAFTFRFDMSKQLDEFSQFVCGGPLEDRSTILFLQCNGQNMHERK